MDIRTATTVRRRIAAAHTLTDPLAGTLALARDEMDEALGVLSDAVDAEESHVDDLDLTADSAAGRVQLRAARAQLESLEELRAKLEQMHSAIDQAHTYAEEADGLHESTVEALDAITTT